MRDNRNTVRSKRGKLRSEKTVLRSFLKLCAEMTTATVFWDEQLGKLSYNQVYKAICALATRLANYPDQHIGIMMPASAGAYIAYFATLLSGKIPVMINWSQGLREVTACVNLVGVTHVITAKPLMQKLAQTHGEDAEYPFSLIFLDEVRKELSFLEKCRVGICMSIPFEWMMRWFGVFDKDPEDVAVILFTSGTEKLPKGVPLTNASLLANQRACFDCFSPKEDDAMISFLPPFHAYGFNSCTLFPLLSGIPVVFAYNPLYAKKIVEMIDEAKVTLLGSTPVFLSYVINAAKKSETTLPSLRFVVVGGDVFKHSLYQEALKTFPHVQLRQGYGTTECSPVITINTVNSPKHESCVGMPVRGMEVLIVSEETKVPVSTGVTGLVLTRGTSLFKGYLGEDFGHGFIELAGETWYVTGDLGYVDRHGELFLKGRLSRFVKIGAEMVSLEAMESIIMEGCGQNAADHPLVVCGLPGEKERLCLFTIFPTSVSEVNDILKNSKTSNLLKISYHHQVEAIPMLGTGKPDYCSLNALAKRLFSE